jgi:hypothetical protein
MGVAEVQHVSVTSAQALARPELLASVTTGKRLRKGLRAVMFQPADMGGARPRRPRSRGNHG